MPTDLVPNNLSSLYGNVVPPQAPGGAGQLQQGLGALSQMMQVQGARQELVARAAMGPLAQASVNPETGEMDFNKFATLIAGDPRTAWKAPEILNQLVTRQLTQAQTLKTSLESANEAQKVVGNQFAGLLSLGDNITKANVAEKVAEMRGMPAGQMVFPSDAAATKFLSSLPADGKPLAQWVRQGALRAAAASNNYDTVLGKWGTIDTGGGIVQTYDQGGQRTLVPGMDKTMTPEQRNAPNTVYDPVSQSYVIKPRQEIAPTYTGSGQPESRPGGAAGVAPPAPGTGGATGEGSTAPPGSSPPPAPGPTLAKPGPQAEAEMQARGERIKKYEDGLDQAAAGAKSTLMQLDEAAQAIKQIKTGGGGNVRTEIGSALQALQAAGFPGITQEDIDKVSNGNLGASQVFKKIALQLSTTMMTQTLRGGGRFTNLEFANFLAANPNLDTDPRAVQKLLDFAGRMSRLTLEEQSAYQKYQTLNAKNPAQYPLDQFEPNWNQYLISHKILGAAK